MSSAAKTGRARSAQQVYRAAQKVRLITAASLFDGHDAAINIMRRILRCQGRMKVLAAINDPGVAQKILRHLGLPTDTPRCAPARAPPELEFDFVGHADFDAEADFELSTRSVL